jgi:hypothetical protein
MDFLVNLLIYLFTSRKLKKLEKEGKYKPRSCGTTFVPFDETGLRGGDRSCNGRHHPTEEGQEGD